jgi:hypothetical protein
MISRLLRVALLSAAIMISASEAARAAAVGLSSDGSTLIYRAAPGEANRVSIAFYQDFTNPTVWTVQDAGAPITAYAGCAVDPSATFVACGAANPYAITAMDVDLGDRDDAARIEDNNIIARTTIAGGAGNDDLLGVAHAVNTLLGQDGNDRINADFISALPGTFGGDRISGGNGDDVLVGGGGADTINGDAGYDRIDDTYGDGALSGGPGDDTMHGGGGNDVIGGDDGNDTITGGDGNDRVTGGAGADAIDGQRGNDAMNAVDGEVDSVACGTGADSVQADASDVIGADEASNCEQVTRGSPAPAPAAPTPAPAAPAGPDFTLSTGGSQRVPHHHAVVIASRCVLSCVLVADGVVRISGRRGTLPLRAALLSLGDGQRGSLRLQLGPAARSALRRALARGRRATAAISVRATDAAGRTSTRTVTVRLRR